jgi:hypothetical protein
MWPTALALEALLLVGYQDVARVQRALQFMVTEDWCECAYQHGYSSWRERPVVTDERLDAFEQLCIDQYRYGGLGGLEDATHLERIGGLGKDEESKDIHVFTLGMPDHIQGCEFVTTRALSRADGMAGRFARAHLWRFAGIQRADGSFPPERHGTGFTPAGILETFARFDHPASRVVLLRALPWIVEAQNEDGSWGEQERAEVSTCAILHALVALGDDLPPGIRPC